MSILMTACSKVNVNIYGAKDTIEADNHESGILEELGEANQFDSIVDRNGRLFYTVNCIFKDGHESPYTIYKDGTRYVQDDEYRLLIIEDDDVYGYDKEEEEYFRCLFIDSYDLFVESWELSAVYRPDEREEILSREDKDGIIYLETSGAGECVEDVYTSYGFSREDVDSVYCEYVIDEDTLQILDVKSYVVKDDEKILYSEIILDADCDEYVPDEELMDGVFSDDSMTLTVITDAGTDDEKIYSRTVTKGSCIRVEPGDDFYYELYEDPGCEIKAVDIDRTEDETVYLKRRNEGEDLLRELGDINNLDAMVERYGRVQYLTDNIKKDGSELIGTVYKDETRYVMDNNLQTIIIEGDEAYGLYKDEGTAFRVLFVSSVDSFKNIYGSYNIFEFNEKEKITSREDKDGLIYLETASPKDGAEDIYSTYGYTSDDLDGICTEYVIDGSTYEILELREYALKDGEKTLYTENKLITDCDKYVPDRRIVDGVFGDDVRTLTAITDAGTDDEKTYTQTVTKGSSILIWIGHDFTGAYQDPEYKEATGEADTEHDETVYLKRAEDSTEEVR